jgi:predicted PurR-regulated permease PerM
MIGAHVLGLSGLIIAVPVTGLIREIFDRPRRKRSRT